MVGDHLKSMGRERKEEKNSSKTQKQRGERLWRGGTNPVKWIKVDGNFVEPM